MSIETASIVVTPNAYKASKLYALKPTDGSGDLDVVRATTATRVNSSGVIEEVLANVPRIDYTGGGCPSILVEPQRTNLVFPSDVAVTQTRTVTAVAHTLSFYGTGEVVLSGVATGTLTGTGVNDRVTLTFTPTAGSLTLTITGSVTNWQLEVGANASSYIPTVASTVTRNADVISKTGISDLIGQTEGTLYIELNKQMNSTLERIFGIYSTSSPTSDNITLSKTSDNNLSFSLRKNNILSSYIFAFTGVLRKIAIGYSKDTNGVVLYLNGTQVILQTNSADFSSNLAEIYLGSLRPSVSTDNIYNGGFNSVIIYRTRLSNAELATLTTL